MVRLLVVMDRPHLQVPHMVPPVHMVPVHMVPVQVLVYVMISGVVHTHITPIPQPHIRQHIIQMSISLWT